MWMIHTTELKWNPWGTQRDMHAMFECPDCGDVIELRLHTGNSKKYCSQKCNPTYIHGESHTKLHHLWSGMRARCESPSNNMYEYYGAKGVKVCDEWGSYEQFRDWAIGAGYVEGLSIDRINPTGNYEPSNCRWLTRSINSSRAKRRLSDAQVTEIKKLLRCGDMKQTEIARQYGVGKQTVWRIAHGELYVNPLPEGVLRHEDH